MPELPEVETVRRILETQLIGLSIKEVKVHYERLLENVTKEEFIHELTNESFVSLSRRGKYLIFILKKHSLVVHLRMEGKFFFKEAGAPLEKHEHLEFVLSDGHVLRYHDTRKFGRFILLATTNLEEILQIPALLKLGPDGNGNLDVEAFYNRIKKSHEPLKIALLSQEYLAGLGNIYVDEVCFTSHLHPETPCDMLSKEDVIQIVKNSKMVLEKAIALGGTTIRSYTSSLGVTGRFQNELLVHTKAGDACPVCGTTIIKIKVGGRGTYLCPKCQKKKDFKVIGMTGRIGAGKTEATNYLKKLGYPVIDADEINREILQIKSPYYKNIYTSIEPIFPEACNDGVINRTILRDLIFNNETKRNQLEDILYPTIKKIIINQIKQEKNDIILYTKEPLIFISAPLLLESGFDSLCDKIWIVDCQDELLIKRIMARDHIDLPSATNALSLRGSVKELVALAHHHGQEVVIIDNNNTIKDLEKQIQKLIKEE